MHSQRDVFVGLLSGQNTSPRYAKHLPSSGLSGVLAAIPVPAPGGDAGVALAEGHGDHELLDGVHVLVRGVLTRCPTQQNKKERTTTSGTPIRKNPTTYTKDERETRRAKLIRLSSLGRLRKSVMIGSTRAILNSPAREQCT